MKRRPGLLTIIILAGNLSLACGLNLPAAVTPTPRATSTLAATLTVEPSATVIPPSSTPAAATMPVLGSKTIQEKSSQPPYNIQGEYAVLQGDETVAGPFNQAMTTFINQTVGGFKQDVSKALDVQSPGSDLEIHFTTPLVSGKVVSLIYTIYMYYAGAAHPNSISATFTYDLEKKQMLGLKDLFKQGADYLDPISTYCQAELKKTLADAFFVDGASPKAGNYKNWTLQLDGLQFYFDPYQVGPYAAGPQKVLIPQSALKDIILPGGYLDH